MLFNALLNIKLRIKGLTHHVVNKSSTYLPSYFYNTLVKLLYAPWLTASGFGTSNITWVSDELIAGYILKGIRIFPFRKQEEKCRFMCFIRFLKS